MEMDLSFQGGKIAGRGVDRVGVFSVEGTCGPDGEISFIKSYGRHKVLYSGSAGLVGISGSWRISLLTRGTFEVHPQR